MEANLAPRCRTCLAGAGTQSEERLRIRDTDVEDYIVGVPILAEDTRQADPAGWAWLTQVHETLARLNEQPIWRTETTRGASAPS